MAKPVTKIRGKFADEKYTGPEPVLSVSSSRTEEIRLLNWYNYYFTNDDAKDFALSYLKSIKFDAAKIKKLASVNANDLRGIGWYCRCLAQGGELPPEADKKLWKSIDAAVAKAVDAEDIVATNEDASADVKVVSVQERVTNRANNLIADIEDRLDEFYRDTKTFDVAKWFRENDVKPQIAQKIADYYKPLYAEIYDAQQMKDGDLIEAYAHYKKGKLKVYLEFVKSIIAAAEQRQIVAKAVRKPRKKKEKPASAIVSKLQFLEEDKTLNLKSIKPTEIVGAQQLWVFNVRYRTIAVYNAIGPAGLSVKGTSLLGFDEKSSVAKTLRKPKEQLGELMSGGKVAVRKFMDTIKCKPKVASRRINKDTILLKVAK